MKILFILPDVNSPYKLDIHFGIASIAGFLKKNGYRDVRFTTVKSVGEYGRVLSDVAEFKPDIVGFTSVETQFRYVIDLSARIKEARDCVVVCGGAFVTIFPDCVKDARGLDGIFVGESELSFLKFVRAIEKGEDPRATEGFCFHDERNGKVVVNKVLPAEDDLDVFGMPDRDIFNFQEVIDSYGGAAPFMFNRGCPYNCSFCSNHALASVYGRISNRTRRKSTGLCINEIKDVIARYKVDVIHVWDDLFTSNRKWLYEFLDIYKKEVGLPFMCTTRSNLCDDDMFRALRDGGCYKVHMSLESGNDFIRNKVMKRSISRDSIIRSFGLANKHGIKVSASSIIGLPFETEEMIRETIDLLALLRVESPGVNIFYPYKGTKLRAVCEEYGLIAPEDKRDPYNVQERKESVLTLPHISRERLQYYHDNFEKLVRRKEGAVSYFKNRIKNTAKTVVPEKILKAMRKSRLHRISDQNFPVNLDE